MLKFAANLSMLFTEVPFVDRFDRAAAAGFRGVEFLFPYDEDLAAVSAALRRNSLELVLFNLPAGDFAAGERGLAGDPARKDAFRAGVARALEIASDLRPGRLNCLAGKLVPNVGLMDQWQTLVENVSYAAEAAARADVRLVVEPLNAFDAPGFLLPTTDQALSLIEEVGHPNLALQFDCYHQQRSQGNLVSTLQREIARIGHVQIADSPDRGQPGTGEIHYPFVLAALANAGYDGWVSLEYKPIGGTETSLGWLRDWGYWT